MGDRNSERNSEQKQLIPMDGRSGDVNEINRCVSMEEKIKVNVCVCVSVSAIKYLVSPTVNQTRVIVCVCALVVVCFVFFNARDRGH